ncbi:MAG: flagellar export protein FliJ [Magnetococcales bacterium]|nr:flagellar export protein FliJ [Magnetococcales bacterium]
MNRFQRLVELRKIREESAADAFARAQGRIQKNLDEMATLDRETESEKQSAKENLVSGCTIPPQMYENFFRGQVFRKLRLEERQSRLQAEAEVARRAWLGARTLLEQAKKLAEKDDKLKAASERRKESKEMDMVGILGVQHSGS